MSLKILLLAPSREGLEAISRDLPPACEIAGMSTTVGGVAELLLEVGAIRPDLVVAELPDLDDAGLVTLESTLGASPSTWMILLSPVQSPEFQLRAMRAGVREVLRSPLADGELRAACERLLGRIAALRGGAARVGKVLAFLPAKGGSGSTFLATNLAYALAVRGQRVALLDLNLQFGDASLFLTETRSTRTIVELARDVSRIDGAFLESSMLQVSPTLWMLPAPDTPEASIDVNPEAVERIVSLARTRFDFVVMDMGRVLEAATLRALDQADTIYITLQLTLPFIHDTKRLISLLRSLGYSQDKTQVIVNRFEKGGEITIADAGRSIGARIDLQIPNSFAAVAYSINHGIPLLKSAARDPVAKALVAMADGLAPQPAVRKRGWFGW